MRNVDKSMVLDLLDLIDDDRRVHETAAVMAAHPAQRARFAELSRREAALVSVVRRGMAHLASGHASASEQARRLDEYMHLLVDNYLDSGNSQGIPMAPRPRERRVRNIRPRRREQDRRGSRLAGQRPR